MAWSDPVDDLQQVQQVQQEEPDFIGGAPNYDKYPGVDPEQVLVWLNID